MKWLATLAVCLVVESVAAHAMGETPADAQKRSVSLFEGARRQIDAGQCVLAIPMLEESLQLNQSVGAHLSLSQCVAPDDPLAAWRELKKAERLALARGDGRAEYARAKAAALAPRVALLRIELQATTSSVEVRVDGELIDAHDTVVAVSSGEHVVELRAPGRKPSTRVVRATIGVVVPVRVSVEDGAPIDPAAPSGGGAERDPAREGAEPGSRQRVIGGIVAAVGLAALAFSSVAGILALDAKSDLRARCTGAGAGPDAGFPRNCGGGSLPPATQAALASDAETMNTWATVSTAGFVAGAALLAAGATVYLTAPRRPAAASLRVSPLGAIVEGRF